MGENSMQEKFLGALCNGSKDRQMELWSELGHQLTVSARGLYPVDGRNWEEHDIDALRCINELSHRIYRQISALASDGEGRFPNQALLEVLQELATAGGHEMLLVRALRRIDSLSVSSPNS